MRVSIRKQLLTLFMPLLVGLWVASAIVSYWLVSSFAQESFDKDLASSADSVAARLRVKNGRVSVDMPLAVLSILQHRDADRFYYSVISADKTRIAGDPNVPESLPGLAVDVPRVTTSSINGKEVRLAEIMVNVEDGNGNPFIVQVAETTNVRKLFQQKMLLSIAVPQLMVVALGLFAVWYGVTKILTPLQLLQRQLSTRSRADLSELPDTHTPEEVFPLVNALNQLLSRLRDEMKAHQRFIANAAHQLRTPLAGLKTYSSIGSEMTEAEDLKHIVSELDSGIDRSSRIVGQLLALARTDGGDQDIMAKVRVDLSFIVSDVTAELVDQAVRKDVELIFEPPSEPALVNGDQTALRHMVSNLVENALQYTPEGGKVRVQVARNDHVSFRVTDTGPGIPFDEREKVFERFYRVNGTTGSGSGLGLSIVQEVANAHNAAISITSGPGDKGTQISVEFPKFAGTDTERY